MTTSSNTSSASNTKQYTVEVADIGVFTFARRTMRLEFAVQAEQSRLTEGLAAPSSQLELFATVFSELKVLVLEAPKGWDLEAMDPNDPATWERLLAVHQAFRAKELSFRPGSRQGGQVAGPVVGGDAGVLVPAQVPAAAN